MTKASVSFKTIGCRLNQAETAMMRSQFLTAGYKILPFGEKTDVSIIHGCVITEQAEKKTLRRVRKAKRINKHSLVILTGCIAELAKNGKVNAGDADLIVPQHQKFRIPELISLRGFPLQNKISGNICPEFSATRAFIKIQDGCDFKCAYCIVPYTRGNSVSIPVNVITEQIKALCKKGYKEFVLTGANIGCFDYKGQKLINLLHQIEAIPQVKRLRISSIELSTVEKPIIDYMADSRKLCPQLHIPLQSGSDKILKKMGRHYNKSYFTKIINYASSKLGDFGLGTDIIAGLPGENENDFNETLKMVNDLPFNKLHVFGYSPRTGTAASLMKNSLSKEEIKERVRLLITLGQEKRSAFLKSRINKRSSVLIEKTGSKANWGTGWTEHYLPAKVYGKNIKPNQIISFIPKETAENILTGHISDGCSAESMRLHRLTALSKKAT
jgi:threonylcarbamoyladenosine tRNA methylthiotransferase MtaB